MSLIAKSEFVGLEGVAHLCTGGEAPWLRSHDATCRRFGVLKSGGLVRARLSAWFEGAGAQEYARAIQVYYGPQSGHDLLERTTWVAAQHLRQLHALSEERGLVPPEPLSVADFEGLPLPASLW